MSKQHWENLINIVFAKYLDELFRTKFQIWETAQTFTLDQQKIPHSKILITRLIDNYNQQQPPLKYKNLK
jgi:hypothetical protein